MIEVETPGDCDEETGANWASTSIHDFMRSTRSRSMRICICASSHLASVSGPRCLDPTLADRATVTPTCSCRVNERLQSFQ